MKQPELTEFWGRVSRFDIRAVQIIQKGKEIYLYDCGNGSRRNQYSITKSITSAAAGIAIHEKMFGLDDPVYWYLEEAREKQGMISELKICHLLTMTQGFERPLLMGNERKNLGETDWVSYVCNCPVVHRPGTRFDYNNAGPYLLGVIIQRLSGQNLIDYLMPRLFEPLGIERPEAEQCPMGYTFGAGGIRLNIRELGKIGQLYQQKGRWKDRQLIQNEWIEQSTRTSIRPAGNPEDGRGYGFLFWTDEDGLYMARGRYGQFCVIFPRKEAIISINAKEDEASDQIYDAVKQGIIPLI